MPAVAKRRRPEPPTADAPFAQRQGVGEGIPDPRGRKALILSPHPDDESIGCGGTAKLISERGGEVHVCYLTRGELGFPPGTEPTLTRQKALKEIRSAEAEEACRLLGISKIHHLGGRDAGLAQQSGLVISLRSLLRQHRYDWVFSPWPLEAHPDHAATFHHFIKALPKSPDIREVWLYEVWTPVLLNRAVNIDTTIQVKLEAIRAHRSQTKIVDFPTKFLALAQYRSLFLESGQHAEAFLTGTPDFILSL